MRKQHRWLPLLLILVACGACRLPTADDAAFAPLSSVLDRAAQVRKVDRWFHSFIDDHQPGGAVIVIQKGQIQYQAAYGLADLEQGTPLTTRHLFHLGSIGKQFTALAIMLLVERGALAYDDPISTYLPELDYLEDAVTIRRLLHHTSGLPNQYDNQAVIEQILQPDQQPTNQDVIRYLALDRKLTSAPGQYFVYNNVGYELLGALIERISGMTYAAFLQENIFDPLRMTHTFALPNPERRAAALLPHSYIRVDNHKVAPYDTDLLDNLGGAGGTYSTIGDMYLYDQALYTEKLVKQTTLAEAFVAGSLNDDRSTGYGFAWMLNAITGTASHSGQWLGFTSCFVRNAEKELSVVVLFNRTYDLPDACISAFHVMELYEK